DDIQENKADVTLKMAKPLPATKVPQPGAMLTGRWVGKATSYSPLPPAQPTQNAAAGEQQSPAAGANGQQPQPAGCLPNTGGGVMLTLTDGAQQEPTRRAPPARRGTTRRRPASR
ncbi:MAG TPA: hypothetical protein VM912_14050, partial [Terriglobales bacterium]|nr:hypothetical protein [Terriglobales bacterium]